MSAHEVLSIEGKVVLNVDPGACRLKSQVISWLDDDGLLQCRITSACKNVTDFGEGLGGMDPMIVLHLPFSENQVYLRAGVMLKHATCPVPLAVLKAMEVASGLGIKRDVHLTFDR